MIKSKSDRKNELFAVYIRCTLKASNLKPRTNNKLSPRGEFLYHKNYDEQRFNCQKMPDMGICVLINLALRSLVCIFSFLFLQIISLQLCYFHQSQRGESDRVSKQQGTR